MQKAANEKGSENKLQLELKNIKYDIFKKKLKMKNYPKSTPKKFKKLKKSCKRPQIKKEEQIYLELKNIKNDIFKNFKKLKMTQKTLKSQKIQKFKNSYKEVSNKKFQ